MGAAHLREKAADYLRLARGLSPHSPTRRHLIVMAEQLERQAKNIDKEFDDAAAQGRRDQAGNSESNDPDL
jgi:protein tyrosine/serine phosphatase